MAVKIVECPRDAMQGMKTFIPTKDKIILMQSMLSCGFNTLDCGSFVSDKHVPQMADTADVLQEIGKTKNNTRLLVIVANERGAHKAASFSTIDDIGFPFSINETFQQRNTNADIQHAFSRLVKINDIAKSSNKSVVAYISMAFGNPYGDVYTRDHVLHWTEKITALGINTISLSDTVGAAKVADITYLFANIKKQFPTLEVGAHFHALPNQWVTKISAAYSAGCRRFDGALLGFGGCPMAADDLTGNIPTEGLIQWLNNKEKTGININNLSKSLLLAGKIYH